MGKVKYKKGPHGIKFSASIFPWKVKRGKPSFIQVTFLNDSKDKELTPAVIINKIVKKGFLSKTFSATDNDPSHFWITSYATTIMPLEPKEEAAVLIPIYTKTTTENGDYKIFIKIQAGEKGLGDYAKLIGKIAVGLFVGWRSVEYYLPFKVLNETEETDSYNDFMSLFGIKIGRYHSFIPAFGSLTIRREIFLIDRTDPSNIVDLVTHRITEEHRSKVEQIYRKMLPTDYKEQMNINIDNTNFEVYISESKNDGKTKTLINVLGYVDKIKRIVYIRSNINSSLTEKVLDLLPTIEFLTEK